MKRLALILLGLTLVVGLVGCMDETKDMSPQEKHQYMLEKTGKEMQKTIEKKYDEKFTIDRVGKQGEIYEATMYSETYPDEKVSVYYRKGNVQTDTYVMPTEQPRKFQPSHSFENNFPQKERNQTAVAKSS